MIAEPRGQQFHDAGRGAKKLSPLVRELRRAKINLPGTNRRTPNPPAGKEAPATQTPRVLSGQEHQNPAEIGGIGAQLA